MDRRSGRPVTSSLRLSDAVTTVVLNEGATALLDERSGQLYVLNPTGA